MNGLLSHTEFLSAYQQSDFVLATQRQIIKDFATAGIDFPDNFPTVSHTQADLIALMAERIKTLESTNSTAFFQLLYQIDLPERTLTQIPVDANFHTQLAEFILKREAYKVFLRSKFSS